MTRIESSVEELWMEHLSFVAFVETPTAQLPSNLRPNDDGFGIAFKHLSGMMPSKCKLQELPMKSVVPLVVAHFFCDLTQKQGCLWIPHRNFSRHPWIDYITKDADSLFVHADST